MPRRIIYVVIVNVLLLSGCGGTPKKASETTLSKNPFVASRTRAQIEQSESNLRNAYSNARTLYTDTQDWGNVTIEGLSAAEPSLTFTSAPSTSASEISVFSSSADEIVLASKSDSGGCYIIRETAAGGAKYGVGACDASNVGGVTFSADPETGGW